jgi:hypothetical protein
MAAAGTVGDRPARVDLTSAEPHAVDLIAADRGAEEPTAAAHRSAPGRSGDPAGGYVGPATQAPQTPGDDDWYGY